MKIFNSTFLKKTKNSRIESLMKNHLHSCLLKIQTILEVLLYAPTAPWFCGLYDNPQIWCISD